MRTEIPKKLQKKIFNSRFFTFSFLLHLILVILLGGTVLFNKYTEPPDFTGEAGSGFVSPESVTQTPPAQVMQQPAYTAPTQAPAQTLDTITVNSPVPATFTMPAMLPPVINPQSDSITPAAPPTPTAQAGTMSKEVARGIAGFSSGWAKGGGGGLGSSLRNREFQFTAYLAKYSQGDWDSTVRIKNNLIAGGSLPNLLYVMGKLSKDKIKADPQSIPLDLSSDEIFAKKPPFIFFTGHKDFKLTDKEVENLQKYLRLGGCIWGDSSVPGRRSRFDLAFRREMRRIVPDVDKDFEELPLTHDIFTKGYYKEVRDVPSGINFYHEPVYALKVYGEIAILYTANDYGDMWQFGLTEKGEFDMRHDAAGEPVAMNNLMYYLGNDYFGNITPTSVFTTYKFGTNIIVHLLTRWEDKVRNAPRGL